VVDDPLGALPSGLLQWPDPVDPVAGAKRIIVDVEVPRVKMWVLAVLSLFVLRLGFNEHAITVPLGIGFAVWCWASTNEALRGLRRNHQSVLQIWIAGSVAVVLACGSVLNAIHMTR